MKYTLRIKRTVTDIGYVDIEADNPSDALRKYWSPDYSKGEYVIFDDEIKWDDGAVDYDYDARVVYDKEEME